MLFGVIFYLLKMLGILRICARKNENAQVAVDLVKRVVIINKFLGAFGGKTSKERNQAAQLRLKSAIGGLKDLALTKETAQEKSSVSKTNIEKKLELSS